MIPSLPTLRQLAERATPGQWKQAYGEVRDAPHYAISVVPPNVMSPTDDHDAEFIAACSPTTILALLDRLARCEAALKNCRTWANTLVPDHAISHIQTVIDAVITPPEGR